MWKVQISVYFNLDEPMYDATLGIGAGDKWIGFDSLKGMLAFLTSLNATLPADLDFSDFIKTVKSDGKAIRKVLANSGAPDEPSIAARLFHAIRETRELAAYHRSTTM